MKRIRVGEIARVDDLGPRADDEVVDEPSRPIQTRIAEVRETQDDARLTGVSREVVLVLEEGGVLVDRRSRVAVNGKGAVAIRAAGPGEAVVMRLETARVV